MHGVALSLDGWRGLVFALHVTFIPNYSSDACSVAPCSLLIIKLLLLHHTHQNHHISGTSRRARRLSGISATVFSLARRCDRCFSALVSPLSLEYVSLCIFGEHKGTLMEHGYIFRASINQLSQPSLSAHVSVKVTSKALLSSVLVYTCVK